MQLKEETIFHNRYQLLRLLGRGGFSEVWLAVDSFTKLQIAIKVYAPGQGMDNNGLQELSHELAGVFNLNHTNLLKPTHVDSWEGMPYLIMPYCSRGSLAKQAGRMSEAELWHVIYDVAAGLHYLHKNDIVHQDIKPDNILLDDAGNYVITDFGISTKARSTLRKSVIGSSLAGGTMAYMGPERFSKQPAPTKASDIWSFGAMLFELLTGDVPFGEMGGGLQKSGAEIPEITANVSTTLKGTIEQMLASDTWDRPVAEKLMEIAEPFLMVSTPPSSYIDESEPVEDKYRNNTVRFSPSSESSIVFAIAPNVINFAPEGEKFINVIIQSGSTWSAIVDKSSADWLHMTKLTDREDGICVWANRNKSGSARNGKIYVTSGEQQKEVLVTQASFHRSKRWIGWTLGLIVPLIAVIIWGITSWVATIEEEEQLVRYRFNTAVNEFDRYLQDANIDNVEILDMAYEQLMRIQAAENEKRFTGTPQYNVKRRLLQEKVDDLYDIADRKYKSAPAGTQAKKRNEEKRELISKVKQRL